jgi:hypothetical protein
MGLRPVSDHKTVIANANELCPRTRGVIGIRGVILSCLSLRRRLLTGRRVVKEESKPARRRRSVVYIRPIRYNQQAARRHRRLRCSLLEAAAR